MSANAADISPDRYARTAGLGYLFIILTGIFAEFFVRARLIVSGDAAATAANIVASEPLFRSAIAAEFIMLACDILVALALYEIFRRVSAGLALLAAFFRLAHAAVVAANLLNLYVPLLLLGPSVSLAALAPAQRQALAMLSLDAHAYGYAIGLVFFGFQCLVLGYLVHRSRYVPRILGILLVIAGLGYLIDSFGRTLLPDYADYAATFSTVVFVPAFVGELAFCLWLLFKGVRIPGARQPAVEGSA